MAIRNASAEDLYLEVPPDVATGRVVVVVGGLVVVVVGGLVVVGEETPSGPGSLVAVVLVLVLVGLVVAVVLGVVAGTGAVDGEAGEGADAPGCSWATVIPMNAEAAPAATIAVLVRRLMRTCTLARAAGVSGSNARLTATRGVAERAP
jgi:hypothetical protein